jgi:hypothetical protein
MPRKSRTDHWICTRRFCADVGGKRRFTTAKFGPPEKSGRSWACKLSIPGVGIKEPILVRGEDQMQAILLTLEGVRWHLENSGIQWRWIHGEKGETGIPKYVHIGFGRKFAAKLESIIDKETENFCLAARLRYDKSLAKRRSRALKRKSK